MRSSQEAHEGSSASRATLVTSKTDSHAQARAGLPSAPSMALEKTREAMVAGEVKAKVKERESPESHLRFATQG